MASTVGSVSNATTYSSSSGTTNASSSASTVSTSASASLGLVQEAVNLSANAGVVALLGASAGTPVTTYNAAGLLNSIMQAANAASSTSSASTSSATDTAGTSTDTATDASSDTQTSDSAASDASSSGSTDPVQGLNINSSWSTILKSNPAFASNVIHYSMEQGIIGSLLNVTA